jgi:hypothetical protein
LTNTRPRQHGRPSPKDLASNSFLDEPFGEVHQHGGQEAAADESPPQQRQAPGWERKHGHQAPEAPLSVKLAPEPPRRQETEGLGLVHEGPGDGADMIAAHQLASLGRPTHAQQPSLFFSQALSTT